MEFRSNYETFKEAWKACPRVDWMLWIAKKAGVDLLKLTTAKALCANTVRHLMRDDRSKNAIDVALRFGKGEATGEELADAAAAAAYDDAAYAAADAAAYAADAAAYARTKNRLATANICREILTEEVYKALGIWDIK